MSFSKRAQVACSTATTNGSWHPEQLLKFVKEQPAYPSERANGKPTSDRCLRLLKAFGMAL